MGLADKGDAFAQLLVIYGLDVKAGIVFCEPASMGPKLALARKLADRGSRSGYGLLADCVTDNQEESKKWSGLAKTAIATPEARAQLARGCELLRKHADTGDALAQYYYSLIGGTEGLFGEETADLWMRKAANQGVPEAEDAIGKKLLKEPKPDVIFALSWLRKAADHNFSRAQIHLSALFEFGGSGVEKNVSESSRWYELVAQNRDATPAIREFAAKRLNERYGPLGPESSAEGISGSPATTDGLLKAIDSEIFSDVEAHIKGGAPVNTRGTAGTITPLQQAAFMGNLTIVRLLIDHGADVKFSDEHGRTALHTVEGSAEIQWSLGLAAEDFSWFIRQTPGRKGSRSQC